MLYSYLTLCKIINFHFNGILVNSGNYANDYATARPLTFVVFQRKRLEAKLIVG